MTRSATHAAAESHQPLGVADLPGFLIEAGLLRPDQIVDGRLMIRDLSRRHRNFAVLLPGRAGLFVKQGVDGDRRRLIAAEARTYAALAQPGMPASIAPRFRLHVPTQGLLVLELLRGHRSLEEEVAVLARRASGTGSLQSMGAALGTLHTADLPVSAAAAMPRFQPFAFQILGPTLHSLRRTSAAGLEAIRIVQGSLELAPPLAEMQADWRGTCLIHGDLRWDNCRLHASARCGAADCRFVDWETAGLGPPWWDFGCLLAGALTTWLSSAPLSKGMPPESFLAQARIPLEQLHGPIRALWAGYRERASLPRTQSTAFVAASLRAAGARLVQAAYERLQHAQRLSTEAVYLLQLAANLLRPSSGAAELVGLAEP